jgi:hypothetical protein
MNFPVLTSATYNGTTLVISGSITTEEGTAVNMFVFANSECDPSGYGEGERFLGSIGRIIPSDPDPGSGGTVNFGPINNTPNPPLTEPTWLTMSASDPESSGEFSLCLPVDFTS